MIKGLLASPFYPDSAKAGDQVTVRTTVTDIGDEGGWFQAILWYTSDPTGQTWTEVDGGWQWLDPRFLYNWTFNFAMPNADTWIYLRAYHWDTATQQLILDAEWGSAKVSLITAPKIGPKAALFFVGPLPATAKKGDVIQQSITLQNIGDSWGTFQPWVRDNNVDFAAVSPLPYFWVSLDPNGTGTFVLQFTMPDHDVSFSIAATHWNYDTGQWIEDQRQGPLTVALQLAQPQFQWVGETYS